jgi:hypothetical protein
VRWFPSMLVFVTSWFLSRELRFSSCCGLVVMTWIVHACALYCRQKKAQILGLELTMDPVPVGTGSCKISALRPHQDWLQINLCYFSWYFELVSQNFFQDQRTWSINKYSWVNYGHETFAQPPLLFYTPKSSGKYGPQIHFFSNKGHTLLLGFENIQDIEVRLGGVYQQGLLTTGKCIATVWAADRRVSRWRRTQQRQGLWSVPERIHGKVRVYGNPSKIHMEEFCSR